MKSYCLPFLLHGFEAVTLSGTTACLLDACIDRAVYKIFGLANKDNTAEVRTCLGLHSIRSLVCTRRAKFMDSLLDTASRALIAVYCAVLQCGPVCVCVSDMFPPVFLAAFFMQNKLYILR